MPGVVAAAAVVGVGGYVNDQALAQIQYRQNGWTIRIRR